MSYQNLKAEMTRYGVTQVQVARSLEMTANNLWLKLNERVPFTVEEARAIQSRFFPDATLDYLFASDGNAVGGTETTHR